MGFLAYCATFLAGMLSFNALHLFFEFRVTFTTTRRLSSTTPWHNQRQEITTHAACHGKWRRALDDLLLTTKHAKRVQVMIGSNQLQSLPLTCYLIVYSGLCVLRFRTGLRLTYSRYILFLRPSTNLHPKHCTAISHRTSQFRVLNDNLDALYLPTRSPTPAVW